MIGWRSQAAVRLLFYSAYLPLLLLLWPTPTYADSGPQPPCGPALRPGYPEPGAPPAVQVWFGGDLDGGWQPGCTGWDAREFTALVATAARFRGVPNIDGLLERIGAVSELATVRYWSATRKRWRDLITDAYALRGPDRELRRPDFSPEEFQPGRSLYFWQDESTPAGKVVYRMRVRERTTNKLVLEMENALPISLLLLPLFDSGEYQFLYFFERESEGVFRYYSLMRTAGRSNLLARSFKASFVNRAVAVYRHIAGIPTDQEPPPSR